MEELARFILGGTVILVSAEHLAMWDCAPARSFFLSPVWTGLRYALIAASMTLAVLVTFSASG